MKFYKKIVTLLIFLIFCGIISEKAEAAKIYFDPAEINVKEYDKIQASIFVDTREQTINALEMTVKYPPDLVKFVQTSEKDSIVSLWLKSPKENQPGEVSFSGLVPSGFKGEKGLIETLIFETKKKGSGKMKISDFEVLLNDNKGTELSTIADEMAFSVSETDDSEITAQAPLIADNDPPEDFKAEIIKEDELFGGKWSLVFEAQDRISGIDHYEIQETKSGRISDDGWKIIERGPYLLSDQKLRSYIYVKAFDGNGNSRIVKVPPKNSLDIVIYSVIFILAILIIILKLNKNIFRFLNGKNL